MFVLVTIVSGEYNCTVNPNNPCVCRGTDFKLNLSKMLKFPELNIADNSSSEFKYKVDLCSGISCNEDHTNECGCQSGGKYIYSLGKLSTAKWTIESTSPWKFSIECTEGDASQNKNGEEKQRSVVFNFEEQRTPKKDHILMVGLDDVTLQYTFEVVGRKVKG